MQQQNAYQSLTYRVSMHLMQKKSANGTIEMEKHEAVVSGIMSSVGFDTLELSDQTTKVLAWCT